MNNRLMTKQKMIDDRKRKFKKVVCDCCGGYSGSLDMHEIVSRYRTQTNLDVRKMTYEKEICVLLCDKCHKTLPVSAKEYTDKFFEVLYKLYGKHRVKDVLFEIPKEFRVGISLPE